MNKRKLLSYTGRDYSQIFKGIANIAETIDPRVSISEDRGNPETILTKMISASADMLSYNLDRLILECFPSTVTQRPSAMDIFSIIGYVMHRYRSAEVEARLYNKDTEQDLIIYPFQTFTTDNGINYCNLEVVDLPGNQNFSNVPTKVRLVEGQPVTPPLKKTKPSPLVHWTDMYEYNLNIEYIVDGKLKMSDLNFDPETIYIRDENNQEWTYIKNPFMVNANSSQFSVLEDVTGVYLVFSKNIYTGFSNNLKMFYLNSSGDEGMILEDRLDFSGVAYGSAPPHSEFYVDLMVSHRKSTEGFGLETASMARENSAMEFGFRQSTNSLITSYDFERAVSQLSFVSAVRADDQNSIHNVKDKFSGHLFVILNEDQESILTENTAISFISQIRSHILREYKLLPLELDIHIDDQPVTTDPEETLTKIYTWHPDVTIYTRRSIDTTEGAEILNEVNKALTERYKNLNVDFNEVPLIRDIIDKIENAHELIEYLDIDGYEIKTSSKELNYVPKTATRSDVTCKYQETIEIDKSQFMYDMKLTTEDSLGEPRNIQFHSFHVMTENNELIAKDNGDGLIISDANYLVSPGTIDYKTGDIKFTLNVQPPGSEIYITYNHETPTFCKFRGINDKVKIGRECFI